MIIFCRGLVLRCGDRQLEFERDLGDGRVQFKYLDTFEVCTFRLSKLYQDILDKRYVPVHVSSGSGLASQSGAEELKLPSVLTPQQQALVEFRMRYVRAVIQAKKEGGQTRAQQKVVCQKVWDGIRSDEDMHSTSRAFKKPTVSAVEVWVRKYRQADGNPYALLDRRAFTVRLKRVNAAIDSLIGDVIAQHYLKPRGVSVKRAYGIVCQQVKQLNLQQGCAHRPP